MQNKTPNEKKEEMIAISIFTKEKEEFYSYLSTKGQLGTYYATNRPETIALYNLNHKSDTTVKISDIVRVTLKDTNIELSLENIDFITED